MVPLGRGHEAKSLTSNGMLPHDKTKKRAMVATLGLEQWRSTTPPASAPTPRAFGEWGLSNAVSTKLRPLTKNVSILF